MLFMLVGLNACDKKPAKQEKKVKVEAKAADTPADDIFFYTSRHRAEEYIPTEEKMGFGSQILSINPDEFKDNKSIKEVWVSPKIKHIANNAFVPMYLLGDHVGGFTNGTGGSQVDAVRIDIGICGIGAHKVRVGDKVVPVMAQNNAGASEENSTATVWGFFESSTVKPSLSVKV